MNTDLETALTAVSSAFDTYPRRPVLDRCPHCGPPVHVDRVDLFWLLIKLGNTVGDRADVKALLPMFLGRLVTTTELDADLVLGLLDRNEWLTWPPVEQRAVADYLNAVWRALLAEFPAELGAFTGTGEFLGSLARAVVDTNRFLREWSSHDTEAADRHLALLVSDIADGRIGANLIEGFGRGAVRDRLFRAFERDCDREWAGELARAYDLACCWEL
ncbi:hypothetical protein ACWIGI_21000 [Nocardia sp. NPDC055321]